MLHDKNTSNKTQELVYIHIQVRKYHMSEMFENQLTMDHPDSTAQLLRP